MRSRVCVPIAAAALIAALAVPGAAFAHGTHVKANLKGSKVVGDPGAPNGKGTANLHLLRNKGKVRFQITFKRIGGKKGLNIGVYRGKKGEDGNELFTLLDHSEASPIKGNVTNIPKGTLKQITRNPGRYHVNVKNNKYPTDGAIRGQLRTNND